MTDVKFIKSAADRESFIKDGLPHIIFVGRSNVGKSSAINAVLERKNMAFTGGTPGKTAHVNYFLVNNSAYFTDLPGYGYANVSKTERARWGRLMEDFFADTAAVELAVMIVDARHKPTADDVMMINLLKSRKIPHLLLANKSDKLKKSEYEIKRGQITEVLKPDETAQVILFSAVDKTGVKEASERIKNTLNGCGV